PALVQSQSQSQLQSQSLSLSCPSSSQPAIGSPPPMQASMSQSSHTPLVSLVSATAFQRSIKQGQLFCLSLVSAPEPVASQSEPPTPSRQDPVPSIPCDYDDFAEVFSKESARVLPPHRPYDHRIPLEPGATPPFGPLYSLSEVELKALDEYIKENLSKGY